MPNYLCTYEHRSLWVPDWQNAVRHFDNNELVIGDWSTGWHPWWVCIMDGDLELVHMYCIISNQDMWLSIRDKPKEGVLWFYFLFSFLTGDTLSPCQFITTSAIKILSILNCPGGGSGISPTRKCGLFCLLDTFLPGWITHSYCCCRCCCHHCYRCCCCRCCCRNYTIVVVLASIQID